LTSYLSAGSTIGVMTDSHHLATLIRQQFALSDVAVCAMRALAHGSPVGVEHLAEMSGRGVDEVRAELDRHPGLDWNDRGELIGWGLTLRETPHRFSFEDRTVYGFCASDTFLFSAIVGRPGVIESSCPATGATVRVEVNVDRVTAVSPPDALVSRIRPDHAVADFRAEICALGSFFASPDAAAGWLAQHPTGEVVALAEDFATTYQAALEVGWLTTH
jgi:alkylmercury lyase